MKKGEATKQRIIEACAPVFNEQGFGNTSLSALMEVTGLEKGGIYRHFSSKEELANDVFDYTYKLETDLRLNSLDILSSGEAKIKGFIKNFSTVKSCISGGCPIFNMAVENDDGNPVLKKKALTAYTAWVDKLASFIDEGKKEGFFKKSVKSQDLAQFILNSIEGGIVATSLTGKIAVMTNMSKELISFVNSKSTSDKSR